MKFILLLSFLALATGKSLLGEKKCTYGPSYWCASIENAHKCGAGAVVHCVSKVWPQDPKIDECQICTYGVTLVHEFLSNKEMETKIVTELKNVCSLFGSQKDRCLSLIDDYAQVILETIASYTNDPKQVCSAIGMCKGGKAIPLVREKLAPIFELGHPELMMPGPVMPQSTKVANTNVAVSPECELCEFVINKLKGMISSKPTEEEIRDALDKVCSLLPSSVSLKCQEFVNTFTPAIINLLIQYMDAGVVCRELQLCSASKLKVESLKPVEFTGVKCEVCTVLVGWVEGELKKGTTQEEIEKAVEKLCDVIPIAGVQNECVQLVREYTSQILILLTQKYTPSDICKKIGMCGASKFFEMIKKAKSGIMCTVCVEGMTYLEGVLNSNVTQAEIEAMLSKACQVIPTEYQSTCKMLVKEYVPHLIRLFEHMTPQQVCTEMTLCSGQKGVTKVKEPLPVATKKVKSGVYCQYCKMLVSYVDEALKNNATEAEIKQMMDSFCEQIPVVGQECEAFVNEYLDEIINVIESVTPDQVCQTLGLCTAGEKMLVGGKRCTWGPSYWCSSIAAAKACKAYEHCMERKWKA